MGHMGTYMVQVPLHISGLILHGAFQTKFLGILYHKLWTFMVIRRGAGSLKCHFRILENFFIMIWRHAMVLCWGHAPRFLCYQLDFLLDFFYWRKVLSGAKGCHPRLAWYLIKALSNLEGENSKIGHFSIGWVGRHIMVLLWGHSPQFLCYQLDFLLDFFYWRKVLSGAKGCHLIWLDMW